MKWTLIVLIVLAVLVFVVQPLAGIVMRNSLTRKLLKRDFAGFDQLRKSFLTRYLVRSVNLFYLDLNRAFAQGEDEKVSELFSISRKLLISDTQKSDICVKTFYYFLSKDNEAGCRECYSTLKEINPDNLSLDMLYDTFIEKGYRYLEEVLEAYKDAPQEQKVSQASLLAAMYENKGDHKTAAKYQRQRDDLLKKKK